MGGEGPRLYYVGGKAVLEAYARLYCKGFCYCCLSLEVTVISLSPVF